MENKKKIEIYPIDDDGRPYYRTVVSDVQEDETGQQGMTISDIFHLDTLAQSIAHLARMFPT